MYDNDLHHVHIMVLYDYCFVEALFLSSTGNVGHKGNGTKVI